MESGIAIQCMLMLIVMLVCIFMQPNILVQSHSQVPCLFFFGDSLFDNGNNNNLRTLAKVDYYPYGIDYGAGNDPTGRFTNGKNIADFLAEYLGFADPIPPFVNATVVENGLNYASGAAGILDESGSNFGQRFPMNYQLINHKSTISRMNPFNRQCLQKCLYIINIGSNDYINNYFLPGSQTRSQFTPDQFSDILIQQYTRQFETLCQLGARKIVVFSLGLIGCIPRELMRYPPTDGSPCVDSINSAVILFNQKLRSLVTQPNHPRFFNANFTYIDSVAISTSGNLSAAGITVTNAPCCMISQETGQCAENPSRPPCSNRNQYVFFDAYHPTSIVNQGIAAMAYGTPSQSEAYPVNIRDLALA